MAKVTLSPAEMNLITQQDFILTKNKIIAKVYDLLGNANNFFKNELSHQHILPNEIVSVSAKIYKGENYKELPWVMLDFPRYFNGKDAFAIRCFFWWGNFVSINFLVQGKYVLPIKTILPQNKMLLENWFLCNYPNPWQHYFENDNFLPISHFSKQQIDELGFIKLAKKIPLQEWDNIETFLKEGFLQLLQLFNQTSFLGDETIL